MSKSEGRFGTPVFLLALLSATLVTEAYCQGPLNFKVVDAQGRSIEAAYTIYRERAASQEGKCFAGRATTIPRAETATGVIFFDPKYDPVVVAPLPEAGDTTYTVTLFPSGTASNPSDTFRRLRSFGNLPFLLLSCNLAEEEQRQVLEDWRRKDFAGRLQALRIPKTGSRQMYNYLRYMSERTYDDLMSLDRGGDFEQRNR